MEGLKAGGVAIVHRHNLAGARWKSTWLLLRARVAGRRGALDRQEADAQAALAEIQGRLGTKRPDPYLVAEAGFALALLDRPEESRSCLMQARALGVSDPALEQFELAASTMPLKGKPGASP